MKINIIGTGLFKSGGMRVIFEYANRLKKRGHDICYYFPLKPYRFGNEDLKLIIKRYYWGINDFLFYKNKIDKFYECNFEVTAIPKVNNCFVRDADILMATQWPTAYDVNKLSESKGKKTYFLQDYEIWNSDITMVDKALQFNLKKITISKYNQDFFLKKFNIESHVILNGIDFQLYDVDKKPVKQNKTITFIEHHLEDKGIVNAIEVVYKLKKKYGNLNFISFGHRKYHDIPEFVTFFNNPDDKTVVEKIYSKTDVFLYPSLKEGFALPPAEAMACRCAVITTNVGAIPEYSKHMESAIHVNPGNIDEMFNAVCYLLDNEAEITRLSENAYISIRKTLDWNKSVIELEKYLKSALDND